VNPLVDLPHPSFAELFDQTIFTDS